MEEIDYKEIVFQNVARGTDDDIVVIRAYLTDNMEQSGGILAEEAVWSYIKKVIHSDVEYMARIEGMPKHFAGVVFDELDRDVHLVPDFMVPIHWSFYEAIDPAEGKPIAWSFFAVCPDEYELTGQRTVNRAYQIGYLKIEGQPISEITRQVRIKRAELGYTRPLWAVLDAKYGVRTMQTGEELTNWHNELQKHDPGISYILSESKKGSIEAGETIIKEYLKLKYNALTGEKEPTFQLFKGCEHSSDPFNPVTHMFSYAKQEDKPSKRTEEYKDFVDNIRYFLAKYPRYWDSEKTGDYPKPASYFNRRAA